MPALADLQARFPNLRVSMVDLEPEDLCRRSRTAIWTWSSPTSGACFPASPDRGIEREKLLTEPVYLALPAGHRLAGRGPVALADLRDEEWIVGRDSTSMLDLVVAATRRQGYEPRTDFHSMDFQVILSAVGAGLGVALVPPLALIGSYPNVEITRVSDLEIDRTIWAAIRKGSKGNPGIAAVLEALQQAAADIADRIPTPAEEPPAEAVV